MKKGYFEEHEALLLKKLSFAHYSIAWWAVIGWSKIQILMYLREEPNADIAPVA